MNPDQGYKAKRAALQRKDRKHQEWRKQIAKAAGKPVEYVNSNDIEIHGAKIPHPHSEKRKARAD
jgi:hypothetical protein